MKLPTVKGKLKTAWRSKKLTIFFYILFTIVIISSLTYKVYLLNYNTKKLNFDVDALNTEKIQTTHDLEVTLEELNELKNQDQVKINEELEKEITNIQKTYKSAVDVYESLIKLKESSKDTNAFDKQFAEILSLLSSRDYKTATEKTLSLEKSIKEQEEKIAQSFTIPESIPVVNSPPGSGYSRQQVTTDAGTFMVSLVAVDLGNTRVVVDTASDSDCNDNCPVLPLSTYVSRNGAFAGINGSYFCPASYPSCAGKTNTFDLLIMNKNKTYFNSSNNVYSNNPGVIFGNGYIRFVSAVSQWGRDTSIDSMLSNYPLLIQGGNISFGGDDDPKKGSKGARSFVANKGNTVYIGVVHNATVAESARTMKALGMENALNLDNGGSTALWSGGYKVGPGRDLPNVVLFIRK